MALKQPFAAKVTVNNGLNWVQIATSEIKKKVSRQADRNIFTEIRKPANSPR